MIRSILRGCAAGAMGTTVLNAVTYADMALRERPSSSAPEEMVDRIAARAGHPVPDSPGRDARLTGLGALSGIAVGTGAGALVAVLHRAGLRPPLWLGGPLTGALATAAGALPLERLGVSDPATWSSKDWASDAVPHFLYGLATYGAVAAPGHRA
jgi:hypothetical protein